MKTMPAVGQTVVKVSPVSPVSMLSKQFYCYSTRHRTWSCGQLQTQQSLSTLLLQRKRDTIMQLSASLGTDEGKPRGICHYNTAQALHDRLSTELKSTPFFSVNFYVRGCSSLNGQQLICIALPLRLFLKGSVVGDAGGGKHIWLLNRLLCMNEVSGLVNTRLIPVYEWS